MMLFNALFHQKISKTNKPSIMSLFEKPLKPKRKKKVDVPVHKVHQTESNENDRRVYSAQFNGRKKVRHKDEHNKNIEENEFERISHRRNVAHTNDNLEHQEHLKKKILHLKEKLRGLKVFNNEILEENTLLKSQYQELLGEYEKCQEMLNQDKDCSDCEILKQTLEKCIEDNNAVKDSNQLLIQDINMFKNVVYRLNVHMERYQEKLRKHNLSMKNNKNEVIDAPNSLELVTTEAIKSLSKDHLDHAHTPISWGSVNSHTLGPLLDAYQETLDEKEEIIQNYELELSHFTGKLQEIVDENENLHKRLTEDDECSAKLSVELDKTKSDLKSSRNENDLLIKKCALKQTKLEEILQCYEQKVEQLRRDYNVVVEQYHKSRNEISALKEKNKTLVDSQDEYKNEKHNYISLVMHNSSVNECKKWYEELKNQYEQEKLKMKENLTIYQNQVVELNKSLTVSKSEKEELENKFKASLKKMESKNTDLQKSLQEMVLSRNACRKQLHKTMTFAKELVAEQEKLLHSLHLRQRENKVVKQIGSDIANRMDLLKSQLKTVQREAWQELSTVEQRIQDQDSIINELKRERNDEVERLKEIIKQKEQTNILLKNDSSTALPQYTIIKNKDVG